MKTLFCGILGACCVAVSAFAQTHLLLECSLQEGSGTLLQGVPDSWTGRIVGDPNVQPVWQDGELHFSGNAGYGAVRMEKGGEILSGLAFGLSVEIKPSAADTSGYLLAAKSATSTVGGFALRYSGSARELVFLLADGRRALSFTARLTKPLAAGIWHELKVEQDGSTLRMRVNGEVVFSEPQIGLLLARGDQPLFIGNYSRPLESMFTGSLRNVRFWTPALSASAGDVVRVNRGTPVVDGVLTDDVWKQAVFQGPLRLNAKASTPALQPTVFAFAGDEKCLYVAIRCGIGPAASLAMAERPKDDPDLWQDDNVELFLLPWGTDHAIQLTVNPKGAKADALLQYNLSRRQAEFDPEWRAATSVQDGEWITELALPYDQILASPETGELWRFNLCRQDRSLPSRLHWFSSFGVLPPTAMFSGFSDQRLFRVLANVPRPDYDPAQTAAVKKNIKTWGVDQISSDSPFALTATAPFLFVGNNRVFPNAFLLQRDSGKILMREKEQVLFQFDLPEGISLIRAGVVAPGSPCEMFDIRQEPVQRDGAGYTRYALALCYIHPAASSITLFMRSALPDGAQSRMYFRSTWADGSQNWAELPLRTATFPFVEMPEDLISCYAWIAPALLRDWPEAIPTLRATGFNMIPLQQWHPSVSDEEILGMVATSRSLGMKVLAVSSPFGDVRAAPEGNSTGADGVPLPDIQDACPAYRGQIYQQNLARVEDFIRLIQPDAVQFDIECYLLGVHNALAGHCRRCAERFQSEHPGPTPEEGVVGLGTEIVRDLSAAVRRGRAPDRVVPPLGLYHTQPGGFSYQGLFRFDDLEKAGAAQWVHPVYYNDSGFKAGTLTRAYRKMTDSARLVPWVSNGWNGYTPPETNYDMVLNAYGSGAQGLFWYGMERIETADFYYIAKGMDVIRPVATLLARSAPLAIQADAPEGISVSALSDGACAVVLVAAAPNTAPTGRITIRLPDFESGRLLSLPDRQILGRVSAGEATFEFAPLSGARTALYVVEPAMQKESVEQGNSKQ